MSLSGSAARAPAVIISRQRLSQPVTDCRWQSRRSPGSNLRSANVAPWQGKPRGRGREAVGRSVGRKGRDEDAARTCCSPADARVRLAKRTSERQWSESTYCYNRRGARTRHYSSSLPPSLPRRALHCTRSQSDGRRLTDWMIYYVHNNWRQFTPCACVVFEPTEPCSERAAFHMYVRLQGKARLSRSVLVWRHLHVVILLCPFRIISIDDYNNITQRHEAARVERRGGIEAMVVEIMQP